MNRGAELVGELTINPLLETFSKSLLLAGTPLSAAPVTSVLPGVDYLQSPLLLGQLALSDQSRLICQTSTKSLGVQDPQRRTAS